MADIVSSKRLLQAVVRQVNPMVIRLVSVSDHLVAYRFGLAGAQIILPVSGVNN